MQKHVSEMKIVSFTDLYCCFITFYCSILFLFYFYFTPCHVLSIMMFKCTLMKEQINFLKSKSNLADYCASNWLSEIRSLLFSTQLCSELKMAFGKHFEFEKKL